MNLKNLVVALVPLLLISTFARADFDVAIGHHTFAADGLPKIGPGEQVSVFYCLQNRVLGDYCALRKCMSAYGLYQKYKDDTEFVVDIFAKLSKNRNAVIQGKCIQLDTNGSRHHSLVMVGPKGDNRQLFWQGHLRPTRDHAFKEAAASGFPVDKGTVIIDLWFENDWEDTDRKVD